MKKSGFTLVELLIAIGISAVFISAASQVFGQIYLAQKKVEVSQSLYDESRFLMERLIKIMRENTIDYDRYFEEVGPDVGDCSDFDSRQTPASASNTNNQANRTELGYPTIFYWDTNDDEIQDQNLGGVDLVSDPDPCTIAFSGTQTVLYLINANRTIRTLVQKNSDNRIEIQRQLGADRNGDGIVDFWSSTVGDICQIEDPLSVGTFYNVSGNESDESFCEIAHEATTISPQIIFVDAITFNPTPDRDPFLSFRVTESRIHPSIFVSMETSLNNPTRYNFSDTDKPWILLQTTTSSRLFGNTR